MIAGETRCGLRRTSPRGERAHSYNTTPYYSLEKARLMKIYPQPRPKGHGIALAVRITFETENPPGSTRVTRAATLRQPISAKEADVPGNSQPSATLNFRPFEQLRPIPIAALTDSES